MIRLTLACVLLVATAPALAGSSAASSAAGGSSATSAGASASSNSTSGNNKVVRQARDDAASFVASDGRIRSVRLEAAIIHLRRHDPAARDASDMQLAKAILAL